MGLRPRLHAVPDEFGTGLTFGRLHRNHGTQDEFACKQAKKDEFQLGPKLVRYRVNGVYNREFKLHVSGNRTANGRFERSWQNFR